MSDKKQSQFIKVDEIPDDGYVGIFGSSVNRAISKDNLFKQMKNEVVGVFIYPTIELLQAADLKADEDFPTYVRVEETEYRLYKITNVAAGPNDITLDNGLTAQFQQEYSEIGFVVGPSPSVDRAIAVFDGDTGNMLDNGPVIGAIGEGLIEANSVSENSYIKINPNNSVSLRNTSQFKSDLSIDNVNNTSDLNKPISTATQLALNEKVTGPASSGVDQVALFNGTTGKEIKTGPTLSQILNGWIIALYNIFPRKINTWAEIATTDVVGAGQLFTLAQHTSGGLGGGTLMAFSGSVTDDGGTQKNSATSGFYLKRISYENLTLEMFGAIGDGIVDDTAAIIKAITATPSGGNLRGRPASYLIAQTLVFTKPINLHLATKESARFLVSPTGSYLGSPYTSALYFPATSSNTPSVGNAIRSVLSGFTVTPNGSPPPSCYGILNSTVVYFYEVDVNFMSSAGFATIAGNGSPIPGNANGSTWNNCGTYLNQGHGWYFLGDDANQCTHYRSVGAGNVGYGFYDDGLLGNTYVGCEVIANTVGGYFATSAKPNRSSYFNCYAESQIGAILWNISDRCLRFGSTGGIPTTATELATGGVGLTAQATSPAALFSTREYSTGEDATIAGNKTGGKWACLSGNEIGYQGRASGRAIRIKDVSANYAALQSNTDNLILFPYSNVTSNITSDRPFFANGLTFGSSGKSAFMGEGTAAPTTGSYTQGAIWMNTNPTAGGFIGWICVSSGSPGTWKTFGQISV